MTCERPRHGRWHATGAGGKHLLARMFHDGETGPDRQCGHAQRHDEIRQPASRAEHSAAAAITARLPTRRCGCTATPSACWHHPRES